MTKPKTAKDGDKKKLKPVPYPLAANGDELTNEQRAALAHFGDPCKYCNVAHDDVAPGPCPGMVAAFEFSTGKGEKDGKDKRFGR